MSAHANLAVEEASRRDIENLMMTYATLQDEGRLDEVAELFTYGAFIVEIMAGRYSDRFFRRDGRWWFAERLVHTDLIGNMSGHVVDSPMIDPSPPLGLLADQDRD